MGITVEFPEELLVACGEDREQFTRRVMVSTLGQMIQQGKISSGFGARVLGCDRWEFYHLLTEYGFSVIDYASEDAAYEARTSRELAKRLAPKKPYYQNPGRLSPSVSP